MKIHNSKEITLDNAKQVIKELAPDDYDYIVKTVYAKRHSDNSYVVSCDYEIMHQPCIEAPDAQTAKLIGIRNHARMLFDKQNS